MDQILPWLEETTTYDAMDLNRWSTAGVNGSAAIHKKFIAAFICHRFAVQVQFRWNKYVAAGSTVNIYQLAVVRV